MEAEDLLAFIDRSPSPYHAVAVTAAELVVAGSRGLDLGGRWPETPGRFHLVRGGSLVAWTVPEGVPAHAPFRLVGAHTDSPNLRVKPRPDVAAAGWRKLGVEVYGGALLNTWLDRDLGLSGRVVVRTPSGPDTRLVLVDRPLARIPQLAIHLDRDVNDQGLRLDRQVHLAPVWGAGPARPDGFAAFLAAELDVDPDTVGGWDLMFHDLAPGARLGADGELLSVARIDNLCSTFAARQSLLAATPERSVAAICLFDHEEVGSQTATGADGALLATVLERSVLARGGSRDDFLRAVAGSVCVSADGAHASHPNYPERHEPSHPIRVNAGPVIKINTNQRYATDAETAAVFESAADRAGVPVQRFVNRTDLPCGTTIGPLTAANLGMATVDVGVAQLAMHSARELCGADDPGYLVAALTAFLE